ncbi:MAG: hypothetical protein U0234_05815 [Sandaracinus sp.]
MRPRALALLCLGLLAVACGPSLRRVHRASAYFEECYAADLDSHVSDADRRSCWRAWRRYYEIGASPERLDYVRERLAMLDPDRAAAIALSTGDDGSIEQLDEAAVAETTQNDAAAQTPTEEAEATDTTETASGEAIASEPEAVPGPTPSEAAPADPSHEEIVRAARHARAAERHLRRGVVAPVTLTPHCPCAEAWEACSSACLADDRGCVGACRREHLLCSRSCY